MCDVTTQGEEESQIKHTPGKMQVHESQVDLRTDKVSEEEKKMDVIDNVSEDTDQSVLNTTKVNTAHVKRTSKVVQLLTPEKQMKQSDQLKQRVQRTLPKTPKSRFQPIRKSTAA